MNIHLSKESYLESENKRLHEVNQELLKALKKSTAMIDNLNSAYGSDEVEKVAKDARAAIAKGETT